MFQDSILEFRGGWRGRWIALGSVVTQVGLVAGFVAFPLLYPAALPAVIARMEPKTLTLARPAPPPAPARHMVVRVTNAASMPAAATSAAPPRTAIARPRSEPVSDIPVLLPFGSASMGTNSPLPTGIGAPIAGNGTGTRVTLKPSGNGTGAGPVRISTGVSAGLLLTQIRPNYPAIAKASRVSGTVVVTATIDTEGRIVGAQAISGPMMLRVAATDAVKEARYRPFLLNGKPTEVETTFSVNFVMGS